MAPGEHPEGQTLDRVRSVTKEPTRYRVLLHNDDYTTMEFVVDVLESVFQKSPAEAYRIMMQVHTQHQGVCGVYPYDVAETKAHSVGELARREGFPLQISVEEE
ncbi:MAG: ATP-dependent Clp protease adaptor ClpS [Acidobacteria bacterium]|jgi:ATP-dependent Clp protease adaptor protein ClpS|nr:ATP-dependent Clp protease adaptor ClpS [Acidobacteriota bacterium]MBF83737.1 ATP-dependent Clp protease adaptor ClpS [Acidobacteriota bacterium]|tara:strand:+ start:346 stop:657 length:312 start_codon:yes stop_codon:yes gene_type:complete